MKSIESIELYNRLRHIDEDIAEVGRIQTGAAAVEFDCRTYLLMVYYACRHKINICIQTKNLAFRL